MTPSSSGSRSPSRAAGGNSPSSSTKSTPPWLRLISPGRSVADPPPISPTVEVVWCGARNGGVEIRPPGGIASPAAEWTIVTASDSVAVERRKQAGQSLGEHRLARSGRADHQQVVPAGGGDLQCPTGDRLAADVGEVGRGRWVARRAADGGSSGHGASPSSAWTTSVSVDAVRTSPSAATWASAAAATGTTTSCPPSTATIGATPGTRRSVPSRPSSPTNARSPTSGLGHLTGRHEDADGDRQVETGTDLARARRRQVDRDALVGPLEIGAHHGGADAVAGFAAGPVRLADDAVAGQALADVDLDGHGVAADAEQAGGRDGSEHGGLPRHGRWIEGGAATAPRRL